MWGGAHEVKHLMVGGLRVSGLSVSNERVSCRNIQWEWWIFQSAGKQQAVCSRQSVAVTWEGTLWCLCRQVFLGTSNPLHSHTIKGSWDKSPLNQVPIETLDSISQTDWWVLIPWRLAKMACNRLISTPGNASWNQWEYPLSLTHRSNQSTNNIHFVMSFYGLHLPRLEEHAIKKECSPPFPILTYPRTHS
jgi:hypothetical protein